MKGIRIFLLILIILGIIALITQKFWVPKLVDKIISSQKIFAVLPSEIPTGNPLSDGRQCYMFDHEATKDAPYTVNEFLDITVNGKNVIGSKTGIQNGPDMSNGYDGTIAGNIDNDIISDVFSYTIEGSQNNEKEIYRTSAIGLIKLRYPLIEEKQILVPDTSKAYQSLPYARVECTGSN